jgi:predicted Zn-dependent protease
VRLCGILALASLAATLAAAADWNASPAFQHFYNLDYDRAVDLLEKQAQATPDDPNSHNHLAQAILYRALLKANALDPAAALSPSKFLRSPKPNISAEEQQRFQREIDTSLKLAKSNDAASLYAAGVAHIHRANFEMFVNKSWRTGLREATKARELHQKALTLDPKFTDARLIPATHDYIVGSLPWWAKALGFLAGIRGDKAAGLDGIRQAAQHGSRTRVEARVVLALTYQREGQPAQAARVMDDLCREFPRNYLYRMQRIKTLRAAGEKEKAAAEMAMLRQYPNLAPARLQAFLQEAP